MNFMLYIKQNVFERKLRLYMSQEQIHQLISMLENVRCEGVEKLCWDAAAALQQLSQRTYDDGLEAGAKIADMCEQQNGPLSYDGIDEKYHKGLVATSAKVIATAIRAMKGK